MNLTTLDYLVFGIYFALIVIVAVKNSTKEGGEEKNTEDFFLAGRNLPWWIIGTSLIASNISAEQLIGMSGSAFVSGIAIVSYEWLSALTLLIIAKWFLPYFLEMRIYSMPQYLEERFDKRISVSLGVFWVLVYIFVNLTSILYLGALTLETILGFPPIYSILGMAILSGFFTIYGGLSAVAWTDFIQVAVLFGGGLLITILGLQTAGSGEGILVGFQNIIQSSPDKFHTILSANHKDLPWIGVFFGGMWVANLSYWGFNQYITQRALAAKNIEESRNGLVFAAFLKILVPVIVVLPGVTAFYLYRDKISTPDMAYPTLIKNLVPVGMTGLILAALMGAIVSSLNSMTNSTATIFTMDIYRKLKGETSEKKLVLIGRIVSGLSLLIAVFIAPSLGGLNQVFQYIQEYTGMVSPGIVVIFLFGLFWRRANSISVLWVAILTVPISILFKFVFADLAFLNRMGVTFLALVLIGTIGVFLTTDKPDPIEKKVIDTSTSFGFNLASGVILSVLMVLYYIFQ
ncbi:MAG: sodium/solute symporter [Leptospiraceae bacterium]|nr:sodium/solute symporter [Leptospiraceae bacterium]MCP5510357.1 sodium/solute symporter [Leptospiraceae bacterium]